MLGEGRKKEGSEEDGDEMMVRDEGVSIVTPQKPLCVYPLLLEWQGIVGPNSLAIHEFYLNLEMLEMVGVVFGGASKQIPLI